MPIQPPGLLPNRRAQRAIWLPSLSVGFRVLLLVRFCAAMYSNIQDCDEVYNYWEPLHYLQYGSGFQTWETSPKYAIRSWAYVLLHWPFATSIAFLSGLNKRRSFFAVRTALALISSFSEATYYRSIGENMNDHIGRYVLFLLLSSPGMWIASTALLPSSFSMYFTMLALSYSMKPASRSGYMRTLSAVTCFALSAIVGWPFALLLAAPFVFEELFVWGGDRVPANAHLTWRLGRWKRLLLCGLIASFIFVPVVFVDSLAYGKLIVVPWNIIKYNIFGEAGRGPELYGTEPWHYYLKNLLLNFNIVLPLALLSLPALAITHTFDYPRLGFVKHRPDESSPYTLLSLRLAPFYIWLGILSMQPHKEERFMYPIFPLVCFNGATTLYLMRGWVEKTYTKAVSVYAATQTRLFGRLTLLVISTSILLSVTRIGALYNYYHAPFDVSYHFEHVEVPRLLNVTGLLPPIRPKPASNSAYEDDYVDIRELKQLGLRVCYGKEWHRFPSHYMFPDGVEVQFIKSAFSGHLPQHFPLSTTAAPGLWWRNETRVVPQGLNDMNKEEPSVYVDVDSCDYLVDLDFPLHDVSPQEPRYAVDAKKWERAYCTPFLDAEKSPMHTRMLYIGLGSWQEQNSFGDYCLLRNRERISRIEAKKWKRSL